MASCHYQLFLYLMDHKSPVLPQIFLSQGHRDAVNSCSFLRAGLARVCCDSPVTSYSSLSPSACAIHGFLLSCLFVTETLPLEFMRSVISTTHCNLACIATQHCHAGNLPATLLVLTICQL